MKILFVAVFNDKSTNVSQSKCLRKCGALVVDYDYRARGVVLGRQKRDVEIIELCKQEKPDAVIFSKCNHPDVNGINYIPIDVFNMCKKLGSKVILWYMDPMYNYDNELVRKVVCSDIVFCALEIPYQYALKGNRNTFFLQEGFDPEVDFPVQDVLPIYDVTFIGNLHGERTAYYNATRFHNITNAFGHQHAVAVGQSKINLNFTEASAGTSDRTYKILAAGGFLLTQQWDNMTRDFSPGEDFAVFNSIEDLKNQIQFYLANTQLREEISFNGCRTVQKFSRMFWAQTIIDKI